MGAREQKKEEEEVGRTKHWSITQYRGLRTQVWRAEEAQVQVTLASFSLTACFHSKPNQASCANSSLGEDPEQTLR